MKKLLVVAGFVCVAIAVLAYLLGYSKIVIGDGSPVINIYLTLALGGLGLMLIFTSWLARFMEH